MNVAKPNTVKPHLYRVRWHARVLSPRLPRGLTQDDLVAIGMEVVWKILERQPQASVRYLELKIRWAMLSAIVEAQHKTRTISHHEPDETRLFDPVTLPDGKIYKHQRAQRLAKAIETLPERHRLVVSKRLTGVPMEDIAEELGVTPGRATQILTAATNALRKKLSEDGDS